MKKILKKWYFKIYHLLKFLGIFLLIFSLKINVYADDCINLYPGLPGDLYINGSLYFSSSDGTSQLLFSTPGSFGYDSPNYPLKLDNTKSYILFAREENGDLSPNILSTGSMTVSGKGFATSGGPYQSITFTPGRNGFSGNGPLFMYNSAGTIYNYLQSLQFWLVEGDSVCTPPTNTENDEIYSDFLTLYIDRFNYLANGFTTKPYLIAMIAIIFAWVVLELLLKILNLRGGKRK